jgi:hypothetical protein
MDAACGALSLSHPNASIYAFITEAVKAFFHNTSVFDVAETNSAVEL